MEKEFVTYEQALALKELGFDEPCLAFWDGKNTDTFYFNNIRDASGNYVPFTTSERLNWFGAPLKQQVFRWFRENHDINNCISYSRLEDNNWYYQYYKSGLDGGFKTYEEAENACLNKLIKLVKNKTDEKDNNTDNNSNSRLHL